MYETNVHKYYFFYEVEGVFANFLHYCIDISNCKVPKEVLMLVSHKGNENYEKQI